MSCLLNQTKRWRGKDLVNVMNGFADEMSQNSRHMERMWGDVNKKMDKMATDIEKKIIIKTEQLYRQKSDYRSNLT